MLTVLAPSRYAALVRIREEGESLRGEVKV